jgi:hypothetical protein
MECYCVYKEIHEIYFFLFFCLLFTHREFFGLLFSDLLIIEPEDGLVTTANEITVRGHGLNREIKK